MTKTISNEELFRLLLGLMEENQWRRIIDDITIESKDTPMHEAILNGRSSDAATIKAARIRAYAARDVAQAAQVESERVAEWTRNVIKDAVVFAACDAVQANGDEQWGKNLNILKGYIT